MFSSCLSRFSSSSLLGKFGLQYAILCKSASSITAGNNEDSKKLSKANRGDENEVATERRKKEAKKRNYLLGQFFDAADNWGKISLSPSERPGRSWTTEELRLKSNSDLHKLWYVLLREKNMLLTMEHAYKVRHRNLPCPERIDRVNESMENVEAIVHERNDAYLLLETGDSASPPKRTVTSFMGFTYEKSATEHYAPPEVNGDKEYEVPMLDEPALIMQKLWAEKEQLNRELSISDEYLAYDPNRDDEKNLILVRGQPRYVNRAEDLPETVVVKRRREREQSAE